MQIYEELKARGLIAQVTDEEEIRDLVNKDVYKRQHIRRRAQWHSWKSGLGSTVPVWPRR